MSHIIVTLIAFVKILAQLSLRTSTFYEHNSK